MKPGKSLMFPCTSLTVDLAIRGLTKVVLRVLYNLSSTYKMCCLLMVIDNENETLFLLFFLECIWHPMTLISDPLFPKWIPFLPKHLWLQRISLNTECSLSMKMSIIPVLDHKPWISYMVQTICFEMDIGWPRKYWKGCWFFNNTNIPMF